ncbi:MAG: endonuclease domain-containing protein [Isosphaeraceae bacterium]
MTEGIERVPDPVRPPTGKAENKLGTRAMDAVLDATENGQRTTDKELDRHEERRGAGVPTVSVLAGPIGLLLEGTRDWAADLDRPMVLVRPEPEQPGAEGLVVPWVDRLAAGRDLIDSAVAWLAHRLNRPAGLLGRQLRAMSDYEVAMLFDSAVHGVSETGVELVAFRLIELAAQGRRWFDPGLAPELDALLDARGRPWVRVFRALGELVPPECLPVLIVAPTRQDVTHLDRLARLLADLAEAQPRATLALIVEPARFDAYLDHAPESRAKALLRSGIVRVAEDRRRPMEGPIPESGILHRESGIPNRESQDDARSEAERFLFDLLESLPETTGLFELNGTLAFPFGAGRPMEVDFLARSLELVIEIDGYYHFQDPEAYRRDRRKDLELQKRGYVVLRFLADDVVERLEDLLETLLSAVAFCRHRLASR